MKDGKIERERDGRCASKNEIITRNLIGDVQENISSMEWSVYGKIRKVNRNSNANKDLEFKYDAMGNRICKIAKPRSNGSQEKQENWTYTYYVRDAQGNVMAVYDRNVDIAGTTVTDKFSLKELDLYGSSRIGTKNVNLVTGGVTFTKGTAPNDYNSDGELIPTATTNITPDPISPTERKMKLKTYELTNHLGNVIAVVSDKKLGIATTSTTPSTATYYTADVISSSDYYSFGQQMEGRYFNTPAYRYGFNGKDKDDEMKGSGNSYDFGARIYDPRLGKFLSCDPLQKKYSYQSTYTFAHNSPIALIDYLGMGDPPAEPKMADRHLFSKLNFFKGSETNSYLLKDLSKADLQTLYDEALKIGIKDGNVTLSNGQTWYIQQSSGKFHPVSGQGIIQLTQQEVSFLRTATEQMKNGVSAETALANMAKALEGQGYKISPSFERALGELASLKGVDQSIITQTFARFAPEMSVSSELKVAAESKFSGKSVSYVKWGGRALLVVAIAADIYEVYNSENKPRTITKKVGGWGGATVGAEIGAAALIETGPGAIVGGIVGGAIGYFVGEEVTETVYDWIFEKAE